jgi:hypothetical protein
MGKPGKGEKNLRDWNMQYYSYCEVEEEEERTKENEMRRIRRTRTRERANVILCGVPFVLFKT